MSAPVAWARRELLRRDDEVLERLTALTSGARLRRAWSTPLYIPIATHRHRDGRQVGGLPRSRVALFRDGGLVVDGRLAVDRRDRHSAWRLDAQSRLFTTVALIAAPIAVVLAGLLEFVILDGVSDFPLLAIALAPFMIGATVLMTLPNRMLSALGRLNLVFILAIFSPSNPQSYNPQTYLITSLLVCAAPTLLLAAQLLIPPVSGERRQGWLIESARRELDHLPPRRHERLALEEAVFRDATRIGQIATAADGLPGQRAVLEEALSCFDQAAAIRRCDESLAQLARTSLSNLASKDGERS